jgi:hypothetical protein
VAKGSKFSNVRDDMAVSAYSQIQMQTIVPGLYTQHGFSTTRVVFGSSDCKEKECMHPLEIVGRRAGICGVLPCHMFPTRQVRLKRKVSHESSTNLGRMLRNLCRVSCHKTAKS